MKNIDLKNVIIGVALILISGCSTEPEPLDCTDVENGSASIDNCGLCTGGTTGLEPNYLKDCAGICGGDAQEDYCGICEGDNTSCADCAGMPNGSNYLDLCGVCDDDPINDNDTMDCNEDCGGTAVENECGCVGGNTGLANDWCYGCTDVEACNYDPNATVEDGNCIYGNIIIDIDGNDYCAVTIGVQEWIMENLKVTHYRNGDPIPTGYSDSEWINLSTGAYSVYGNAETYGNLYTWPALDDTREVCPEGWHVPTDPEWTELTDFLGGTTVAGGKMKSTGNIENGDGLWYAPNTGATNESGFTALPSGSRSSGHYYNKGYYNYFWSSTEHDSDNAWFLNLSYHNTTVNRNGTSKDSGMSVRCVRDAD